MNQPLEADMLLNPQSDTTQTGVQNSMTIMYNNDWPQERSL